MSKMVTIGVYFDRPESVVVQSMLRAYGIAADLPDWHQTGNAWHWTVALQGIRVNVPDRDAGTAAELLKSLPDYQEPETELTVAGSLTTAFCFFLAGVPYPARRRRGEAEK